MVNSRYGGARSLEEAADDAERLVWPGRAASSDRAERVRIGGQRRPDRNRTAQAAVC